MGANAQTSVPVFTAGQILTAQQQTEINTGIPVFATTTTRDAAFGGAGEKTLAEGQYAYIEASKVTQYYNGSSWVNLSSGLSLIKTQSIGSVVASVTVTDAFSATYEDYLIIVSGGVASTDNVLNLTLGATATGYYWRGQYGTYSTTTVSGDNAQNTTSWVGGLGSANNLDATITVKQPFTAKNTTYTQASSRSATNGISATYGGYLANTTSYTAFTITASTGTLTGGTIRVYGYQNS